MFSVNTITSDDFEKVVLKDTDSQTAAEIIPSCGAILHAFTVLFNGKSLNIIDGYTNRSDFDENVTNKGFKSCKLSPFACRVNNAAYQFEDIEYTIEKFLLNGSALHGLIYDAEFTVTKTWAHADSAGVTLLYQYTATDKGYPFSYNCEVQYELKKDNALTLTTVITNTSAVNIPMQDGWHPYFGFGGKVDELQLSFKSSSIVEFNDALIPTGELKAYNEFDQLQTIGNTSFDNCFVLKPGLNEPACVLKDGALQIQLEIYPDASYPYLQIYTPPHRNSIAIENLSAVPDAFNNTTGLLILQPASTARFTTTYKITSLV
jgi:aldose 1-epimerase